MVEQSNKFDIIVIGGGPGGYTAAIRASQLGLSVALIESESQLGGICLNWGCIPTKALLKQAEIYQLIQRADEFGLSVKEVGFDWGKMIARSREVSDGLARGVGFLMKKNKVTVFTGRGKLTPGKDVIVEGKSKKQLKADHVILATGGRARSIAGVEIDGKAVISSREAMVLKKPPKSIAIIGAGAIGAEFAYFFNSFGVKVYLLEAEDHVLPREDEEVANILANSLTKQGIDVRTGVSVTGVSKNKGGCRVALQSDGKDAHIDSDLVLMAVGVVGNTEGLGLEANGVKTTRGQVDVNGRMETNVKGIYAIGDLAGAPQLAHAASAEAVATVEFIAGRERREIDPLSIPNCTYCQPQVASVGLTEAGAKGQGYQVKVGRFPFAASGKARGSGDIDGLVKLVFDDQYGDLLGAAIVGSEATELIAELTLGKQIEATWEDFATTIHAHPTLSEAIMEAASEAHGEALNI